MRLQHFLQAFARFLRRCSDRLLSRFASSRPPQSVTMPNLISTFLIGSPNPAYYSLTDGIVRPDKRIDLGDALKLAEQDPIWANRGKAIQSYAMLEQSLSFLLADLGGMSRETAWTIFYRISNTDSRSKILQKLLRKKHESLFNLFWNAYFTQLKQINIKRNEIVHWLCAMNAAINTRDMMIVGITLIHPSSLGDKAPHTQITSNELIDFATKCDVFARLCTMFVGVTSNQLTEDEAKPWLDIFQQPLVYPLPADHPLNQTTAIPDNPPQSSQA
jgi:hypothetical protein